MSEHSRKQKNKGRNDRSDRDDQPLKQNPRHFAAHGIVEGKLRIVVDRVVQRLEGLSIRIEDLDHLDTSDIFHRLRAQPFQSLLIIFHKLRLSRHAHIERHRRHRQHCQTHPHADAHQKSDDEEQHRLYQSIRDIRKQMRHNRMGLRRIVVDDLADLAAGVQVEEAEARLRQSLDPSLS